MQLKPPGLRNDAELNSPDLADIMLKEQCARWHISTCVAHGEFVDLRVKALLMASAVVVDTLVDVRARLLLAAGDLHAEARIGSEVHDVQAKIPEVKN
jgi:hypothetical protein